MDETALGAVENAFTCLVEDKVAMPPIMHIAVAAKYLAPATVSTVGIVGAGASA